ncbi:glucosaminidase domain-containing protein [Patulibacter sp.]|uniref:glucosaminidase domain-containing protein n=1 Tax=Patulibacter sp. TaxID=1912859 RepID=UPI0027158916|nr:glucosaminidase domain-containing protein [Patulibacter sp.]MDO9410035.1 glucosaminidase domain-containing protein [Patulibacter sp.]
MPPRSTIPAVASAALLAAALAPGAAHAASGGLVTEASATPANGPTVPAKAASSGSTAKPRASVRPSSAATIVLSSSSRVTARTTPNGTKRAGTMKNGEATRVRCQVNSTRAVTSGRYGTSKVWNRVKLKNGRTGYVPDVYMSTSSKNSLVAPYCGYPDPPAPTGANPQQGRCSSVASVDLVQVPTKPNGDGDPVAFSKLAAPFAIESKQETRVPAAVTLAQGILESASGTLAAGANNYFGIKAQAVAGQGGIFRWGPNAVGCVHKQTNESEGGRTVRQIASFRMYVDMKGSFVDHGLFLVVNTRYAPAFQFVNDPERFAKAIHKAGYATDPAYSNSLINLMNRPELNLKQYDR